ncbi:MAG: GTP cyclohydrolase I FolE [SAR202 cluster bacterium]|nr:GTP cyclohydrolase I FolE [SAR202 cluster bacterium]
MAVNNKTMEKYEKLIERSGRVEKLAPLLREVLTILGEDPEREGLDRTPERWAEALLTYTEGNNGDPEEHLNVIFQLDEHDYPVGSDDMIIVNDIEFTSTCEHHIAPFRGVARIAYIPNPESKIITGLSKLSRVVTLFSRRLQIQERMTQQIANAIDHHLQPLGVIVVLQAVHYCMIQRGVEQRASSTVTTGRRGIFIDKPQLEVKFLEYLRLRTSNHTT